MKATNLEQVIRFFDPRQALSGQHLRFWFVPRPQSPRRRMANYLLRIQPSKPSKLLLVGHRGSGKSTELNKLIEDLDDRYLPLGFDVRDLTGRNSPSYEDLMLVLATQVIRFCIDENLVQRPVGDALTEQWQGLRDWWRTLVAGVNVQPASREINTYLELSTWLGQIEIGASQSSSTREALIDQVNRHMPELVRQVNLVIDQAQATLSPKCLLIVVEGADKVDLAAAEDIFVNHAPTITSLNAAMIYTFPMALRFSDGYNAALRNFDAYFYFHNFAIRHANGEDDGPGIDALRQIVRKRLEPALLADDALDLLVEACGGSPVDLVRLVRNAANYGLDHEEVPVLGINDVRDAIKDLRREISAPLTKHDWQVLRRRHQDRELTNDPENRRLLFNGALIEYSNDIQWCDVHPVLWPLLDHYAGE